MDFPTKAVTWKRVLIDVCTQRDYLEPGAILQAANLHPLLDNLKQIFDWGRQRRYGVVSLVESHRAGEPPNGFPLHCIDGTPGQKKIAFSLLEPRIVIETDNYLSLPPDLGDRYQQLIFRKRGREVFSNPKADRFLTQLEPEEFIIFGLGVERTIKSLALGLLARHKAVAVVSDACGYWNSGDADLSLRQLAAKHIRMVTTADLTRPEPEPTRRPSLRLRRFRGRHHPSDSRATRRNARTNSAKG